MSLDGVAEKLIFAILRKARRKEGQCGLKSENRRHFRLQLMKTHWNGFVAMKPLHRTTVGQR